MIESMAYKSTYISPAIEVIEIRTCGDCCLVTSGTHEGFSEEDWEY